MNLLGIIYILILIIAGLAVFAFIQLNSVGLNVKDFWSFIKANQIIDKLYLSAKRCDSLDMYEQVLFLGEAENMFNAYDKVPNILWEEEYEKYSTILDAYRELRMLRWQTALT